MYKTVILPVVLYECEIWSLTLSEKYKFRVFEDKVLKRIFGPKRKEVVEGLGRLHNEELPDLYPSNIIEMIKSRRMK
jgi:hypothetical protein